MTDTPAADAGATPATGAMPAAVQDPQTDNGAAADDLGDGGRRALSDLRREVRAIAKDRDDWRTRAEKAEDAGRSDSERRDAELDRYRDTDASQRGRITELERDHLRRDAAEEAGLPRGWWKRLHGETADELAADAKSIAADLGSVQRTAPDLGAGARPSGAATASQGMSDRIRDRARRG